MRAAQCSRQFRDPPGGLNDDLCEPPFLIVIQIRVGMIDVLPERTNPGAADGAF